MNLCTCVEFKPKHWNFRMHRNSKCLPEWNIIPKTIFSWTPSCCQDGCFRHMMSPNRINHMNNFTDFLRHASGVAQLSKFPPGPSSFCNYPILAVGVLYRSRSGQGADGPWKVFAKPLPYSFHFMIVWVSWLTTISSVHVIEARYMSAKVRESLPFKHDIRYPAQGISHT